MVPFWDLLVCRYNIHRVIGLYLSTPQLICYLAHRNGVESMVHHSYPIQMEIAGSTAMWTRPDSGDSPVSYPAPTYSACKGIFESILFGPDVEIIPTRVENALLFSFIHTQQTTRDRCARKRALTLEMHIRCIRPF